MNDVEVILNQNILRLKKHPFVAKVLCTKKVICVCGAAIKLSRKWDEDYINRHTRSKGCKRVESQKIIYDYFNVTNKKCDDDDSDEEWEDWDSEVEDAMDDDDIIGVDERSEDDNSNFNVDLDFNENIIDLALNKRRTCSGLHFAKISAYIYCTPANFGGSRRVEVIAKEIWANRFKKGFSRKKLNYKEKRILNRQIYAESQWFIDWQSDSVRTKECNGYVDENCYDKICCTACLSLCSNTLLANRIIVPTPKPHNIKHTPLFWFESDPMKKYLQNADLLQVWHIIKGNSLPNDSNIWLTLADKAMRASFSNWALELFRQNLEGRTIQNIRRLRKNEIDYLTDPDLCYENIARFKRLIDTLHYEGPISAMTDNTKLKPGLHYLSQFGCIIGSVLDNSETKITDYDQIPQIVNKIKNENAIANNVRTYILQDDGATYRAFYLSNLRIIYSQHLENPNNEEMCGFFVLLFVFAVEHFFGVARQINSDFTYADLIHLIPKIAQHSKALRNNNIIYEKEKLVREDGQINFIKMLEICTKHEAYSSRILERKCHIEQIAKNSDLIINPNKASHMVAHFINNENPETRFITQREKCWKTNRKTMAAKLAQQHTKEELARNKESHPDNIVYYLANMDVVVTENSLSLKGFGKIIYNYFNCGEIKAAIVV
ncbi:hypothetical protein RhiirA1_446657 [Rhizophagus irregularis]|uniref:Uncharacterized protein n=1 Tax=Rhizophagus irregularis TaxID=588596 RepID=A0A2N0QYC1_9GLOM|nr:hypothetical protein RhiirA1_446657 [Rhizophagus irregularis]